MIRYVIEKIADFGVMSCFCPWMTLCGSVESGFESISCEAYVYLFAGFKPFSSEALLWVLILVPRFGTHE